MACDELDHESSLPPSQQSNYRGCRVFGDNTGVDGQASIRFSIGLCQDETCFDNMYCCRDE